MSLTVMKIYFLETYNSFVVRILCRCYNRNGYQSRYH